MVKDNQKVFLRSAYYSTMGELTGTIIVKQLREAKEEEYIPPDTISSLAKEHDERWKKTQKHHAELKRNNIDQGRFTGDYLTRQQLLMVYERVGPGHWVTIASRKRVRVSSEDHKICTNTAGFLRHWHEQVQPDIEGAKKWYSVLKNLDRCLRSREYHLHDLKTFKALSDADLLTKSRNFCEFLGRSHEKARMQVKIVGDSDGKTFGNIQQFLKARVIQGSSGDTAASQGFRECWNVTPEEVEVLYHATTAPHAAAILGDHRGILAGGLHKGKDEIHLSLVDSVTDDRLKLANDLDKWCSRETGMIIRDYNYVPTKHNRDVRYAYKRQRDAGGDLSQSEDTDEELLQPTEENDPVTGERVLKKQKVDPSVL